MRKNSSRLLIIFLLGVLGLVLVNRLQVLLPKKSVSSPTTTPTPTPVITTFTDAKNTFSFFAPSSWQAKPAQNYATQSTTEFTDCGETTLTLRRLANIDPKTNKRRTPYDYLKIPTDVPASNVDGLSAITITEATPSGSLKPYTTVVIDATPSAELIELYYTPACGLSLENGKGLVFFPLLSSFTFTR